MSNIVPKLRLVDPRPTQHSGQMGYVLRDPLGLSDSALFLPQALAAAISFINGRRSAEEISSTYAYRYGTVLPVEQVQELVSALDEALLLDNVRTAQAKQAKLAEYRNAPAREMICAGGSYPRTAAALKRRLNQYLDDAPQPSRAQRGQALRGIVSPHIDYPRGGGVYAQAWKVAEKAAQKADLAIIIGTDHYGGESLFTLTQQNYATPYGILPTATPIVNQIAEAIGPEAAFASELFHTVEHSLELPLVWLHHMRNGQPIEVVPILAGSFYEQMVSGKTPAQHKRGAAFLEALQHSMQGRRALVIASGDLSHVGPAFGGDPLDAKHKTLLQQDDEAIMTRIAAGDAEGWFRAIGQADNKNNVCGLAPVYFTLKALTQAQGQLHGYDLCKADDANTSVVTVCGAVLG